MTLRIRRDGPVRRDAPKALIVIPEKVNYFYNLNGRRVAEALTDLGFDVDVRPLADCGGESYDCCLLSNISEVLNAYGHEHEGLVRIRSLVARCGESAAISMDSVMTPWYRRSVEFCAVAGVPSILDLGLWDQSLYLPTGDPIRYEFVRDGLSPSESRALEAVPCDIDDRPIPWAFVGHFTSDRAAFADFLVTEVDPRGFLYIPSLAPITESGSPHLDERQFRSVLRKTQHHIWCSHHHHFYLEPERFRHSLLSGCLPVKVLMEGQIAPEDAPFDYLVVSRDGLADLIRSRGSSVEWRRLREDYRRSPLSGSIGQFLARRGVRVLAGPGPIPDRAGRARVRSRSA